MNLLSLLHKKDAEKEEAIEKAKKMPGSAAFFEKDNGQNCESKNS